MAMATLYITVPDVDPEKPPLVIRDLESYVAYMCRVLNMHLISSDTTPKCSHADNVRALFKLCALAYTYSGNVENAPTCDGVDVDRVETLDLLKAEKAVWSKFYRLSYPTSTMLTCKDDSVETLIICIVDMVRNLIDHVVYMYNEFRGLMPNLDWIHATQAFPTYEPLRVDLVLETSLWEASVIFTELVPVSGSSANLDSGDAQVYKGLLGNRPVYIKTFLGNVTELLHEKEVYRRVRWWMHRGRPDVRMQIKTHFIEPLFFVSYKDIDRRRLKRSPKDCAIVDRFLIVTEDTDGMSVFDQIEQMNPLQGTALLMQLCVVLQLLQSMEIVHNDLHEGNMIAVPTETFFPTVMDTFTNEIITSRVPCVYRPKVYDFDHATMVGGSNPRLEESCHRQGSCNDLTSQKDAFYVFIAIHDLIKRAGKETYDRFVQVGGAIDKDGFPMIHNIVIKNKAKGEHNFWSTFCRVVDNKYDCSKLPQADILIPHNLAYLIEAMQEHMLATKG